MREITPIMTSHPDRLREDAARTQTAAECRVDLFCGLLLSSVVSQPLQDKTGGTER